MATSYATAADVATRLNVQFTLGETEQCEGLLRGVSARMRARLPLLDQWIADGLTEPDLALDVAFHMAATAITVADTGPGARTVAHPEHTITISSEAAAGVRLSDADAELLTPSGLRPSRGRPFSIRPGQDPTPLEPLCPKW